MGQVAVKIKPKTAPVRARVFPRKSPAPVAAAKSAPEKLELGASGRTKLAEEYAKITEAIFRFTRKHKLPPSLRRRLLNCANDLWDLEMEEDGKAGTMDCVFGDMAKEAMKNYKAGKTISLEEALKRLR